jgi:hypothetical protein
MDEERDARLGDDDPEGTFKFAKGDLVALRRADGSADQSNVGTVADGRCRYTSPGGPYEDTYVVRREDGKYFNARGTELVALAKKQAP